MSEEPLALLPVSFTLRFGNTQGGYASLTSDPRTGGLPGERFAPGLVSKVSLFFLVSFVCLLLFLILDQDQPSCSLPPLDITPDSPECPSTA